MNSRPNQVAAADGFAFGATSLAGSACSARLSLIVRHHENALNLKGGTMETQTAPLVALAAALVLFLIFRAIVLWYWRVNEAVALLKSIDSKLGQLVAQRSAPQSGRVAPSV